MRKGKIHPFECRVPKNSKERQAFLSDQSAKKQRKTIEWETLEISSRKLKISGNISCKDRHNKGQKQQGPNRNRGD